MQLSVGEAVQQLDLRGLVRRRKQNESRLVIAHVCELLGRPLPTDLEDLYRESVERVGDFLAISPVINGRMGWLPKADERLLQLVPSDAIPIMSDGVGNLYGLDLDAGSGTPAVYLYNHEREYAREHAAGSSLGRFLLIMGDYDRALAEEWPEGWQLRFDPDLEGCPKAPPEWLVSI